ncbi:MAG: hypothetical protein GY928_00325 [Colwellia sp.]|nr:hypothetical protein [Colwellia sp.]
MKHKTLDLIIADLQKLSEDLDSMVVEDMTLTEAWIPIEDFDSDFEGLCWILYRGAVKEAVRRKLTHTWNHQPRAVYHYQPLKETGKLPVNYITYIIPLHKPAHPNGK